MIRKGILSSSYLVVVSTFVVYSTTMTMTTILPTIDGPYPTTNSPPPTTHLALNVCEALRQPSLCEARDVKEEDELVLFAYSLFSGKQLPAVMCRELRKQKLLSNALDGLCLLCKEHMLWTQWKGSQVGKQSRQASSLSESGRGLVTPTQYRFSPNEYVELYVAICMLLD